MGQVHNELQRAGQLIAGIKTALGATQGEGGVERFSETLQPILDIWSRPEWAHLRRERIWAVNPSAGATVAEFSYVGVFNPAGSNLIVVVRSLYVDPSAATMAARIAVGANFTFDATSTPNSRDTRVPVLTGIRTGSFAHNDASGGLGSNLAQVRFIANGATPGFEWLPVVLSPGFFLAIMHSTLNTALNATLTGYERTAFPGELG